MHISTGSRHPDADGFSSSLAFRLGAGIVTTGREEMQMLATMAVMAATIGLSPAASAASAEPAAPVARVVTQPDWVSKPTREMMMRYYPVRAATYREGGEAMIACTVETTGRLSGCRVVSENPPGYGFGDAALAMSQEFVMRPMAVDGVPVGGGRVTIPIHFHVPPNWIQRAVGAKCGAWPRRCYP